VRSRPDATVIFLIRPDGVDTFERARQRAHQLNVRYAKLPLPGQGDLRFGRL
jgi:hypothetical protein